jgi:cytoskeletal protein CcmA (bactofilin family)
MGIFGKTDAAKPAEPPAKPVVQPPPAASGGPRSTGAACVIGGKTLVKGELGGAEDILVEGTVEGLIKVERDVRVGPTGVVKATIEAQAIVVSGEVIGDCIAAQRVELQATGRVTGNIRAPKIVIAEGAIFKGTSDMSPRRDDRGNRSA